eukprot:gnl/MRDRNA2_/MRDRNA2_26873_c0_seq1.p1 gnl/MRDRNA2_/MRDRNA2_26873_c0~~gnl/MRDRNA2_/MRDRNA2_26873_c0_seq1.p1  ORF type:complete len:286 (-),score=37.59 gnl/MRDRNA2_/MRDRNA2_26873_c0_seq1:276-1133(-)
MYKINGCGAVPDASLRSQVRELNDAWAGNEPLDVHGEYRRFWVYIYDSGRDRYKDDSTIVSYARALLGEEPPFRCLCFPGWQNKAPLHPALEVLACAKLMYHLGRLREACVGEDTKAADRFIRSACAYMQRGLDLFCRTDLDTFVQATFMICLALFLARSKVPESGEMQSQAWQLMRYAGTLHNQCGLQDLAHHNFLSACQLRLEANKGSIVAREVEQDLSRMLSWPGQSVTTDLKRRVLLIRARHAQEKSVTADLHSISKALQSQPDYTCTQIKKILKDGGVNF